MQDMERNPKEGSADLRRLPDIQVYFRNKRESKV
jgi:hypothetical protein